MIREWQGGDRQEKDQGQIDSWNEIRNSIFYQNSMKLFREMNKTQRYLEGALE